MQVFVFGDTADEIELAALDEGRPFFGDSVRLGVVRDYTAHRVLPNGTFGVLAAGKRYQANVTVRTIELPGDPS